MKKILIVFIAGLFSINCQAQNGFLSSSHTCEINGNELKIFQEAEFAYGSGSICPNLELYNITNESSIITLDVIYDTRGFWPTFYCLSQDTIIESIPSGVYSLIVNCFLIEMDSLMIDSIVTLYDSDTSSNVVLSFHVNQPNDKKMIYPIPSQDILILDVPETMKIKNVTLYNLQGIIVKQFADNLRQLNVSAIRAGQYFLKIESDYGVLTEKILIE